MDEIRNVANGGLQCRFRVTIENQPADPKRFAPGDSCLCEEGWVSFKVTLDRVWKEIIPNDSALGSNLDKRKKQKFIYDGIDNMFFLEYLPEFIWWVKITNPTYTSLLEDSEFSLTGNQIVIETDLAMNDEIEICYAVSNGNV